MFTFIGIGGDTSQMDFPHNENMMACELTFKNKVYEHVSMYSQDAEVTIIISILITLQYTIYQDM